MTNIEGELDRFSDRDRSAQLYYTFEPHIKNLVGAADLDYVLPTTFLPIIGGRPHTNDVEGVIVSAIDGSIGEAVTDEKISEVISACKDFLDQAHSSVDLKPSEIMMDGMKLRFRLASKENPNGATRCVIVTPGKVTDRIAWVGDERIPTEVIDCSAFESATSPEVTTTKVNMQEVGPLPNLHLAVDGSDLHSIYMGGIKGETIAALFQKIGRRLLESNVRDFLGDKGINRGMRTTIENDPVSFGAFNNGITMVCRNATVENGKLISIESPSIVNGGQTTVVISKAHSEGRDLSQVTVPLKLVELKMNPARGELFEKQISRFSNTQNNIKGTDQMVNEEPHPSLNEISEDTEQFRGWYYEHRRGMTNTMQQEDPSVFSVWEDNHPKEKRVTAPLAGQLWNAWWGVPHIAASGEQKSFPSYHVALLAESKGTWSPQLFLKRTFVLSMMHDFVKSIVDSRFSGFGSATRPLTIGWFGHLTERKLSLEHFWERGSLSDEVKKILEILCSIIDKTIRTYEEDNPLEWARKDIARDHFFGMDPGPETLALLDKLPLTLRDPLEREDPKKYLDRIGAEKLWDSFDYFKDIMGGNTFGLGRSFFRRMQEYRNGNLKDWGVATIIAVWTISNSLGYSDTHPGENDFFNTGRRLG